MTASHAVVVNRSTDPSRKLFFASRTSRRIQEMGVKVIEADGRIWRILEPAISFFAQLFDSGTKFRSQRLPCIQRTACPVPFTKQKIKQTQNSHPLKSPCEKQAKNKQTNRYARSRHQGLVNNKMVIDQSVVGIRSGGLYTHSGIT